MAKVKIDFDTLKTLSLLARVEYGLAGCIQYGASTFPEEDFAMFPKVGAAKIHLAEGFQNIIYNTRKKALDPLKKRGWDLSGHVKSRIMKELKERFTLHFHKLKVVSAKKYVQGNVNLCL
jgi:fructose-bisphosphate aldolase, class II